MEYKSNTIEIQGGADSLIITILWEYMVYKPYTSHIPAFNNKDGLIYNIRGQIRIPVII